MCAPKKPCMLRALAATCPKLVAHLLNQLQQQMQCNLSAVQSSTEPKIPVPPSVSVAKVPASSASHT